MSWKDKSKPNIKYCLEEQLGWFEDSPQYTQLTENRWNSSGIFSQDSLHCSSLTKFKSSWTKWATQQNSKDELSSFRCSMTSYGELKTMKQECVANSTLVSLFAKRFPAGRWSFFGPGSETKWYFHWQRKTRRKTGSSRWNDDDQIRRKRDTQFSESRVHCPEERSKAKEVEILDTLLCRWGYDWNCFSHNYFCQSAQYLRSSLRCVWGIQYLTNKHRETRIGKTIWPIVRVSKLIDNDTRPSIKYKDRVERLLQQDQLIKICIDAGFLKTVEVGQYFMTKAHWRVLTIYRANDMSWVHFTTRWKINWPDRMDSREHQNWTQPVICKANMEWKLELNL